MSHKESASVRNMDVPCLSSFHDACLYSVLFFIIYFKVFRLNFPNFNAAGWE